MNRAWWGGVLGVVGGVLWYFQPTVAAVLIACVPWWLPSDAAVAGRPARLGRWLGCAGLLLIAGAFRWVALALLLALASLINRGLPIEIYADVSAQLSRLAYDQDRSFGAALLLVGGLLSVTARRSSALRWAVPVAAAATAASVFTPAEARPLSALPILSWAVVGAMLIRASGGPWHADGETTWSTVGGALVSRRTLLTGGAMALVLGVALGWWLGLAFTLLLYAHELGHVLFAVARGVKVTGAPTFLPGLGAFITTAPRSNPWDETWVSLGGPLFGGCIAFAAKLAGLQWQQDWLWAAGYAALSVNLLNLAPVSPFDGGKVVALTGRIGALVGAGLAVVFLIDWLSPLVVAIVGVGVYLTIRSWREPPKPLPVRTRAGVLAAYAVVVVLLNTGQAVIGRPFGFAVALRLPALLDALEYVAAIGIAYLLVAAFVLPRARRARRAAHRYALLVAFGWWWFMWRQRGALSAIVYALVEAARPTDDAARITARARRLASRNDPLAGGVLALGYDVLADRCGEDAADAWLDRHAAPIAALGEAAYTALFTSLVNFGRAAAADRARERLCPGAASPD